MKRRLLFTFGACLVLSISLLLSNVILAQDGGVYDPWIDTNDDGIIDAIDLQALAAIYSTSGTPIDKTALLLELEARLNSLNASLINDYYNITDCDSLFALLGHLHSGDDIGGGTLGVDEIRLGSTGGNSSIYFYADGSPTGESLYYYQEGRYFYLTSGGLIEGDMQIQGNTLLEGTLTIPTTTRYYSIPSSGWQPAYSTYTVNKEGVYTYTTTPGLTLWYAPVNLPHGAVVTQLMAWVYDNAAQDVSVYLYRQMGDSDDQMAFMISSGSSTAYVQLYDNSINFATVDNQNYAYYIYGALRSGDNNHRFANVRITYNITETLP